MDKHDDFEILTWKQLAELLQVSEVTLGRWRRDDPTFPKSIFGNRINRFTKESVMQWCRDRVARQEEEDNASDNSI